MLAESITLRVEPEPSTSTSTELPSPRIEDTAAACSCLHQNDVGGWHGTNHGGGQGFPTNHRGMLSYAYFLHRSLDPFLIPYIFSISFLLFIFL